MKKLFLSAACALTLFAAACSGSPEKQVEKMVDKYTTKVEKAKSAEDLAKVYEDFMNEAMEFDKKYPDFTGDDNANLMNKIGELQEAFETKALELTGDYDLDF